MDDKIVFPEQVSSQYFNDESMSDGWNSACDAWEPIASKLMAQLAVEREVCFALNEKLKSLQATVRKQMGRPDSAADPRQNLIDFITLREEGKQNGWDVEQNLHNEGSPRENN